MPMRWYCDKSKDSLKTFVCLPCVLGRAESRHHLMIAILCKKGLSTLDWDMYTKLYFGTLSSVLVYWLSTFSSIQKIPFKTLTDAYSCCAFKIFFTSFGGRSWVLKKAWQGNEIHTLYYRKKISYKLILPYLSSSIRTKRQQLFQKIDEKRAFHSPAVFLSDICFLILAEARNLITHVTIWQEHNGNWQNIITNICL